MTRSIFQAHRRSALRNPWWVAAAGLGLLTVAVLNLFNPPPSLNEVLTLYPVLAIVTLAVAIPAGKAGRRSLSGETYGSLPVPAGAWAAGQWLASLVPWTVLAVLLWTGGACAGVVRNGQNPLAMGPELLGMTGSVLVGQTLAVSVGYGLGWVLPKGPWAYLPAVLLAWVTSPEMPLVVWRWQVLHGVFLTQPWLLWPHLPGGYGPFPDEAAYLWSRLALLGLALLIPVLIAWWAGRRRREPGLPRLAGAAASLGALVLVAVGLSMYPAVTHEVAYYQEARLFQPTLPVPAGETVVPAAMQVIVDLDPDRHRLSAQVLADLPSHGASALFTLRRTFTVRRVTGSDGHDLSFQRQGDYLVVATTGRAGRIVISYDGEVRSWRYGKGMLGLSAYVDRESTVLPAGWGWYPIPGAQVLTNVATANSPFSPPVVITDLVAPHAPMPLQVVVKPAAGQAVFTNTAGEAPVAAGWLVLAPLTSIHSGTYQVAVSAPNRRMAAKFTEDTSLKADIDLFDAVIPLQGGMRLLEAPTALTACGPMTCPGFPGAAVMPAQTLVQTYNRPRGLLFSDEALQRLAGQYWTYSRTPEEGQVNQVLTGFVIAAHAHLAGQGSGQLQAVQYLEQAPWLDERQHTELQRLMPYAADYRYLTIREHLDRLLQEAQAGPLTWESLRRVFP